MVIGLYSRRTAANTVEFLERVIEEMPFPIQRVQTDRGREFTAYKVQDLLWDWGIKYRPTWPASPHLNSKVERAQKTVLTEFYTTVDLDDDDLQLRLENSSFTTIASGFTVQQDRRRWINAVYYSRLHRYGMR